jgi:aquaporin NIP
MKKALSEFTGTFLLVFCGTGAIVINETSGDAITHFGIAAVFGLVVFACIMCFASLSGAHMNPAVTITQWLRKKTPRHEVPIYLIGQFAGAFAASLLLTILFPQNEKLGATLPAGSEMQSFVLEFILSFFLMLTIIRCSESDLKLPAIAGTIGAVVGLEALFAGPICGASMNPVRSFAPAIVSGHTEHLWLYLIAPVAGMIFAAIFNPLIEKIKS